MRSFTLVCLLCTATLNVALAQHSKKEVKYTTDPATGVMYRFIKHDKNGAKPVIGDFATLVLTYRNDKDSIVFDSHRMPGRRRDDTTVTITIPLQKTFNGCLEQGITLMAAGDSAEFKLSTDSIFLKTFKARGIPPYVHSGTLLTFNIKLVKFASEEQLKQEEQQRMEKLKHAEASAISKYLNDNKITVAPTADSLYIIQNTPGTGKAVENGDSVEVKYKGMFLDGKIFDQSSAHGGKGTFSIQYSPQVPLIKGWIILIGSMKEGGKVTVLIPSKLAYGERGFSGLIPPFTPLLFEIEIVKVTSHGG